MRKFKYYKAIVQFNHNEEMIKLYAPNLPKEPTQVILWIDIPGLHWINTIHNKHLNWGYINTSTLTRKFFKVIMLGKEIGELDTDG